MATHSLAACYLRSSKKELEAQTRVSVEKRVSRRRSSRQSVSTRRCSPLAALTSSSPPSSPSFARPSNEAPYPAQVLPRFLGESGVDLIRVAATSGRFALLTEHALSRGSTVNSYLLSNPAGASPEAPKPILIDIPERMHSKPFLDALRTSPAFSVEGGGISAVVLGNYTPKKWDTLKCLLDILPDGDKIKIYGAKVAVEGLNKLITEEYSSRLELIAVTDGYSVDFGKNRKLTFYSAKTSRWPDGILTFDSKTKILFSHKLFCANIYTESGADEAGWQTLSEDYKFYFDSVISSNSQQAGDILKKLRLRASKPFKIFVPKTGADILKNDLEFIQNLLGFGKAKNRKDRQTPSPSDETSGLQVSAIFPHHGPAAQSILSQLLLSYDEWTNAQNELVNLAQISIFYASAYGNTTSLSEAISRGIQKSGLGAVSVNLELATQDEIKEAIKLCRGFAIGSPTLGGHMPTPVQEALGLILRDPNSRTKPCGVFGSFGWSGEAVDEIAQKMKDAGYRQAFDAIRCKFSPDQAMLQTCEESGTDLGQEVKRLIRKEVLLKRKASAQASMAPLNLHLSENGYADQALGRIVNSMCILTSRDSEEGNIKVDLAPAVLEEAEKEEKPIQESIDMSATSSAMVASWVSQASFNPPGLTVSVAKDRAAESFLQVGGKFVLNIMKDTEDGKSIIKHFLQRFAPGQDRFDGIDVKYAENGCPIIPGSNSYLECTVADRLEAGDHWIVYAQVQKGNLLDNQALTAVHYRKTGSHY